MKEGLGSDGGAWTRVGYSAFAHVEAGGRAGAPDRSVHGSGAAGMVGRGEGCNRCRRAMALRIRFAPLPAGAV